MKTNGLSKGQAVFRKSLVAGLAMALTAAGCELIVDFDRTKIDAGAASDATMDVTGDMNVVDSPNVDGGADSGDSSMPDTGLDTGADSAADSAADTAAADAGPEAAVEAGPEAAVEAGPEAAAEAGPEAGADAAPDAPDAD